MFVETFGAEPERTGKIHEAQAAVEASLSKRNRLNGAEPDGVVFPSAGATDAAKLTAEKR
jgi:hypothetical protein